MYYPRCGSSIGPPSGGSSGGPIGPSMGWLMRGLDLGPRLRVMGPDLGCSIGPLRLLLTFLNDFLHFGQSKSSMVSSVLFPVLSGRPAIFQDFLGLATSTPHLGHLAMMSSPIFHYLPHRKDLKPLCMRNMRIYACMHTTMHLLFLNTVELNY